MITVMPPIHRGNARLDVFVDPTGRMILAFNNSEKSVRWHLNGYPLNFVTVIQRMVDPENIFSLHRFELKPSGVFYAGTLEAVQDTDMVQLGFNFFSPESFTIELRKTELINLVKVLQDYWTC